MTCSGGETDGWSAGRTDSFSSILPSFLPFQVPASIWDSETNSWHLQVCLHQAKFGKSLVFYSFLMPPILSDRPQLGLNTLLPLPCILPLSSHVSSLFAVKSNASLSPPSFRFAVCLPRSIICLGCSGGDIVVVSHYRCHDVTHTNAAMTL